MDLFAVVAYLPQPLAGFVDAIRDELAPGCRLRAHITILPPRELLCGPEIASGQLQNILGQVRSFQVSVGEVRVFPVSEVVHVPIEEGLDRLRELHDHLNQDCTKAPELWRFEPHVTLAQALEPSAVRAAYELAVRRWRDYAGPRSFAMDRLTFVRRSLGQDCAAPDRWVDLETWELPSPVLA